MLYFCGNRPSTGEIHVHHQFQTRDLCKFFALVEHHINGITLQISNEWKHEVVVYLRIRHFLGNFGIVRAA